MYQLIDTQPGFYVLTKDPGVHHHGQGDEPGLVATLRGDLGEKIHGVHRLDSPTSGLLIMARNAKVAAAFSAEFADGRVEKRYVALSDRKPKKKQGTVSGGMARARRGAWKLTRGTEQLAITRFESKSVSPGLRAFLLRPQTGRTHQLRVALRSQGAPILGDSLYGGTASDRTYLHAIGLRFTLEGQVYQFWVPPRRGELFASPATQEVIAPWRQRFYEERP
jgi:tRNA pseudouridine32 synthase/23S rRNA pseudouridine746 synthase